MDITEIERNNTRILRHFLCDECSIGLEVITGVAAALLMRCPRCGKEFNVLIKVTPMERMPKIEI